MPESAAASHSAPPGAERHRVVVVGCGFGGLFATRRLKRADVDVTVIDRATHHLFQPLLYQVATGILSEGEIAPATRDILRRQRNARVVLGEVTDVDVVARTVTSKVGGTTHVSQYDSLILAAGMKTTYFGNDRFREHAPGLKSVEDALHIRSRIFGAFELAEIEPDPEKQREWLTFVVVGGGPTGVEMAGQIAELSRRALRENFRRIDPSAARVILVDASPRILGGFHESLGRKAARHLEKQGVELKLGRMVKDVDERGIVWAEKDGPDERVDARTVVWGAGVTGSELGAHVARQAGVEPARGGRVPVEPDCTLPGHPEVFVVGDLMALDDLPGVAEVGMQSGVHAARQIKRRVAGDPQVSRPFKYHDLGNMASISRHFAIAELGPLRISGFLGWLMWLVVHLTFLTGFKNRVSALFHWIVSFLGRSRAERTFTVSDAGPELEKQSTVAEAATKTQASA
ncbi:MAG: FAD-dependent pyridine nucleotide-disulfide oxidoreductase [Solirubrobacterales bacterium]|nr:FAD-dependent pyridine nucleotide-disulfide oxidoreductase [Solirubrobacterales bacterium]